MNDFGYEKLPIQSAADLKTGDILYMNTNISGDGAGDHSLRVVGKDDSGNVLYESGMMGGETTRGTWDDIFWTLDKTGLGSVENSDGSIRQSEPSDFNWYRKNNE